MRRTSPLKSGLASELANLPALDTTALKQRWRQVLKTDPPPRLSRPLLLRAVAHHLQEAVLGSLKPASRRFLDRTVYDLTTGKALKPPSPPFKPGTRLLREWHGQTYEVILLEDGVLFRGEHWRSLSEVARAITGTRWSGPRFFGLIASEVLHAPR